MNILLNKVFLVNIIDLESLFFSGTSLWLILCNVFVSFSLGLLSGDSEVTAKGTPLDTLSSYLSQRLAYGKEF